MCVTMVTFSICVNDTVHLLYISIYQFVEELLMISFDSSCDILITTCFWLFYCICFVYLYIYIFFFHFHFILTCSSVRVRLIMACEQTMSQQQPNKVSSSILSTTSILAVKRNLLLENLYYVENCHTSKKCYCWQCGRYWHEYIILAFLPME